MKVYRIDRAVWVKNQAVLFTFGRFCDIIKVIRKLIVKLEFDGGMKMKCPKCGKDMILGELANHRGDTSFYWLPQSFIDKHWVFPYHHTKKTIENEGGMIIKANSKVNQVSACYGCKECNVIVVDCN